MRENKKKNKKYQTKVNLFLSHVNHTIFDIGPQAFRLIHCTFFLIFFLMLKKVQLKVQFVSNWSCTT